MECALNSNTLAPLWPGQACFLRGSIYFAVKPKFEGGAIDGVGLAYIGGHLHRLAICVAHHHCLRRSEWPCSHVWANLHLEIWKYFFEEASRIHSRYIKTFPIHICTWQYSNESRHLCMWERFYGLFVFHLEGIITLPNFYVHHAKTFPLLFHNLKVWKRIVYQL